MNIPVAAALWLKNFLEKFTVAWHPNLCLSSKLKHDNSFLSFVSSLKFSWVKRDHFKITEQKFCHWQTVCSTYILSLSWLGQGHTLAITVFVCPFHYSIVHMITWHKYSQKSVSISLTRTKSIFLKAKVTLTASFVMSN